MRIIPATTIISLCLALLAGCTTPQANGPPLPIVPVGPLLADGTPAPLSLAFSDCSEHFGVFPVEQADVDQYMPDGFQPAPFDANAPFASLFALAFTCTSGGQPVSEFNVGVPVVAPEALRSANATIHAVAVASYGDREDVLAVYAAWQTNGTRKLGTVEMSDLTPDNPAARIGHAAGSDASGGYELDTVMPGTAAPSEAGAARIFFVDFATMNVTGVIDFEWTASTSGFGPGTSSFGYTGAVEGMDIPMVAPGIGFHYWGGYDYTLRFVDLA